MAEPADPYAGWTEVPAETDAPPKSFDGWTEVPVNDAPPPAQSGNPARSTQDVSAGYRPIDFEQQLDAPPHHEQLSEDAQRIRDVVGSLVAPTTEDGVDKLSAVLKLAHDTNLPFNTVAEKFDDIYAQHELAKVSPEQWLKENPQLGEFVLRNKAAGVMVAKDKPFAEVSRAINRVIGFVFPSKEDVAAWQKEKPTENMGAEWEARHKAAVEHPNVTTAEDLQLQPGKEQLKRDEQSQAINESPMGFLYVPGLRSKEAVAGLNADVTWWEIRNRRLFGKPTSTLERVAYGYELESQPREYEQGEVGTFVSSAASGVSSSLYITGDIIKGTTAGGLIAGGVGAIGGYIGGGPAGAAEFGLLGLGVGARGGATGGAYFGTAKLEGGGAYKELLRSKLDDGTPVSEPFAAAGSILYENLAAAIEVGLGTVGPLPKALGPAGDLIKNRSRKAAVAELLKNPAFMGAAKRFAKELATTTFEESGEEGLQAMAKDAVSYFASSAQAGGFQKGEHGAFGAVDVGGAIEQSVAAIPASLVQGAYSAGYSHLARKTFQDRALESHEVVKLLAGFTDSPTAHAAPEDVAEALQVGGLRKSVFIEPEAFIRLNQDAKVSLDQATAEFLGENGAEQLAEARAAGKMVEVPLQRYIEKWSGTELAKAMVPHSTVSADLPTPAAINETEMKAAVDALAKRFDEGEEAEPESPGEARWQAATEKQLAVVTGDVEEARQKMNLMRAALRTWAQRFGQSADELFRDQAVIVEAGLNPTAQEVLSRRATELTGEQRAEELYRDEPTGLPNERAFRAAKAPAGKMVGRVAVEGVKWLNDNVSHDRADMMVRSVALALEREGIKPHRIGGADFGFYVQDEAELHSIMERVKAALPESVKGFSITGAMGGDLDIAGKYLDVLHDRLIGEGTRANPRPVLQDTEGLAVLDSEGNEQVLPAERPKGLPEGVAPSSLEFPVVRASPELEQQLKERVGSLKPEDYFNEAYVDPKTGEWTALGWHALPRKKHVASIDVAGLRRVNERYGKTYGNAMLETVSLAAERAGGTTFDFAHLHGDEYAGQSDDPKALEAFVEHVRSLLNDLAVPYEELETGELTYIPLEFHNGFSDDYKLETADNDLNERKRRLKKARALGLERGRGKHSRPGNDVRAAEGSAQRTLGSEDRTAAADPAAQEVIAAARRGETPWAIARPATPAEEKASDYAQARDAIARARTNRAEMKRWFRWCVELKGKGERPKISFPLESAMARLGVVDPINGFSGNEAGRDTARPMKSQGYVKQTGVGLRGSASDAFDKKKSEPMSRNLFKQGPNETTLFYQFPTPEESLQRMGEEQVLRDLLFELGAETAVVSDVDALFDGLRREWDLKVSRAGESQGGPYRVPAPRISVKLISAGSQQFDTVDHAEKFIREHAGHVQYAAVLAPLLPGEHEAREANAEQLANLGLLNMRGASASEIGPETQATVLEGRVTDAADESRTFPEAEIPASKNLPNQAALERATQGGLGTFLKAAEGGQLARVWKLEQPSGTQLASGARGYTEIFNEGMKRLFKVVLNPSADHSTFLHESAHIFLELMTDLAARTDAPERLKEDYATVLKWLDAKGPEDLVVKSESKTDPARERHEKWAKAFERYLLEGKSPARKLVRMFERFRLWLSRVYRTPQMQAHLGELNADIRSVFDRMLATDREIENYEKAMGLDAPVARDVFDTDEDYEKFLDSRMEVTASVNRRLDLASAKDRLREQEGWWKDELKKERELAEEAYEKLPARIAQQTLAGKGELGGIDGPLRLAREDVVAAVGEENVKKFKITTKESEKVSPDEVAEFLNFPTGKAMLDAVLKLPQKDGWVKQRAEEAMREKHPDIVNDMARLKEHVAKGLHGDATLEHVMLQWAALKKKLTDSGKHAWEYDQTPIEAIRRYVKDRVARRTIDRLDVGQALRAERRAADASAIAAMKGNYALAFRQKQKQLLNMFMWMELTHAREEREKFYELATKMSRDVDGGRTGRSSALGKAHPTYREAAASLLEAVGLREPDENHPGASIEELVSRMEADNQVVAIDEVALSNIEIKPRGHKDLTVAEMRVVRDALANIKAAANGQTTVMRGEKRVDFDEQAERIADEGNRAPPIPPSPETGAESVPEMIGGWWQSADGSMLTPETMFGWLANDIHSEVFQSFVLPMQQAKHAEVDLLRGPIKRIVNAFDKMPSAVLSSMRDLVDGKALFPGHTDIVPVPNRRFQILLMLLNSGNESNLKRLTEGRGITEQQLRDAAVKVGITKEEYDWVQSVWDACEDLKKPAFDLEEKMNGVRPEAIVARAFDTPFGQYKGGYFPAVYDKRGLSGVGESQLLSQVMDPHYTPAGTHRSHLKKRADDFADIISLTPQSIYRHLSQVAHDIAFREPVQSVARLLDDDRVKKMLMQRLGDKRFDRLTEWVKDVGRGRGTEGNTHIPAFATLMHTLRAGMSMAVLGGSLQNAIEDLVTGLVTAVPGSELESQHLAAGIAAVRSGFNENVTAAEAKSGELRTRRHQLSRELLSNISKLIAKTPIGRGPLRKIKDHAFVTQEYTDRVVSSAIWIGAERQALAKGETPADAIIFADKVVRGLLPSHHVVDSSAMMRNENIAAMLVFFRYFNTVYNISRRNGPGFFSNVSTPKRAAEALGFLFGMAILGSLARGQGPDPGEPWDQWFTRKLVSGQLGKYPWMGELFELGWTPLLRTSNAHLGTDFVLPKGVREPRNNSIVGMLSSIALLAAKAADGDKEADVRLEAAVRAMGLLSGQPVSQPLKSSMYGYRVFSGQLDPRGAGDVIGGLTYGQGEHQAANVPTLIQDFAEGGVQGVIDHPGPR